jgi:hypothetical protein
MSDYLLAGVIERQKSATSADPNQGGTTVESSLDVLPHVFSER